MGATSLSTGGRGELWCSGQRLAIDRGRGAIYPWWQERGVRRCNGVSSSNDNVPSDFRSEIRSVVIGYE